MAAEMRPILSPKLSRPAASAERVTVKLSHDKTVRSEGKKKGKTVGVSLLQVCGGAGGMKAKRTCSLVGEEDFGLDTDGERDTLAGRALEKRLGGHYERRRGTMQSKDRT